MSEPEPQGGRKSMMFREQGPSDTRRMNQLPDDDARAAPYALALLVVVALVVGALLLLR